MVLVNGYFSPAVNVIHNVHCSVWDNMSTCTLLEKVIIPHITYTQTIDHIDRDCPNCIAMEIVSKEQVTNLLYLPLRVSNNIPPCIEIPDMQDNMDDI